MVIKMINGIADMPEEVIEAMEEKDLIGMLLSYIGHGKYDFTDWSWEPLSSQVYSFDMEVFNTSRMYNTGKSLFAASDGGQNCILLYQTKEWSGQFQELIGFSLDSLDS